MNQQRKREKENETTSSTDTEAQRDCSNNLDKVFEPIVLARFCASFAEYLDLCLSNEQLTCLHKECTEVALHYNDIHLKIQLIDLSFSKKIPFSLRLKEFFVHLSLSENDLEQRIHHGKEEIDIAKTARDKQAEMEAYFNLVGLNHDLYQYHDVIAYGKKCLAIAREIGDRRYAMLSCLKLGQAYRDIKLNNEAIAYCKSCITIAEEVGHKSGVEMTACFIVGKLCFSQSNYSEALLYSERSLENAKAVGDKRYQSMVYLLIQDCHYHLKSYHDAILTGEKCIAASKEVEDLVGETYAYILLGKSYRSLNQLDKGYDCFIKSLAIARRSNDFKLEMELCFLIGKFYYSQEQFGDAVTYMKNCLDIAVKIGNRNQELYAYMALGDSYLKLQEHENAIDCLQKCLDIAKKYGDKHAEGDAYILLGKTLDSLHQKNDAIVHYKKGLDILEEIGEKEHEMQGQFSLGKVYRSCKNYSEAIKSFKNAIIIAWKIGDKEMQKDVYYEIGNIYEFMNQFDQAVRYGKKYMEVAMELGHEDDVMEAYLALGVAYLGLDDYEDTFFNLNEGLKIATERKNTSLAGSFNNFLKELRLRVEELGKATNFAGFISCGHPCLEVLEESSDHEKCNEFLEQYQYFRLNSDDEQAIACLKRQLHLFERCVHYHGTDKVYCLLEMADIHDTLGQYQNSLQCHRESLAIACRVDAKHLQAITYFRQGHTYLKLKWMTEAENSLRNAIRNFEVMFDALGGEDFKISLLDAYVLCFKHLANVLIHNQQLEQAIVVSDRGRARALIGLLQKYGMNGEINAGDFEYKDVKSILSENRCTLFFYTIIRPRLYVFILDKDSELQFSVKHFGCSCTDKVPFDMLIDKALEEMEIYNYDDTDDSDTENRSVDEPPYEAAGRLTEDTKNLTEKFPKLHVTKETRSSRGDEKPHKCEVVVEGSALEMLSNLLLKHKTIYSIRPDGTPVATKSNKYFGQGDEIVIIPDGPLYKVPFSALRHPKTGQYLSEAKCIRLVPSLATLKALQQSSVYHDIKKGALIVGVPSVGKVMLDGQEIEFDDLENVFPEVLGVSNLLREPLLMGDKATKAAVIQRLKQGAAVVHIAAHGFLKKGTIALAPSPEVKAIKVPEEEDYMLTMAEVQQAQVRAQLVVLSCCYSGRGEVRAEGVVSMCRAFLASGARAVVASLWQIDDEAAADLMFKFYIHLMDGKSAGASLQQSMRELRKIHSYREPRYWAPFFLMGDDVRLRHE